MLLSHFGCADRLYHKNPPNPPISEKKIPPRIPPIFVIPKMMPVSMPVDRIDAGRILCRSGVEPPTGTIHPRQIPPATPNPESHPLPNAGQCRSEVAPPTDIKPTQRNHPAIRRAFQNNRIHGLSSPSAPSHSAGRHDICETRKTRSGCGIITATRPSAEQKPAPPPAEPFGLSGYASVASPRIRQIAKKNSPRISPVFFKIGYNPPRNQSEFFDSENQKERNPCIGK